MADDKSDTNAGGSRPVLKTAKPKTIKKMTPPKPPRREGSEPEAPAAAMPVARPAAAQPAGARTCVWGVFVLILTLLLTIAGIGVTAINLQGRDLFSEATAISLDPLLVGAEESIRLSDASEITGEVRGVVDAAKSQAEEAAAFLVQE